MPKREFFDGFCPQGDECSKNAARLCRKETREAAVNAVAWHLQQSPYHNFDEHDSNLLANDPDYVFAVEVEEEEGTGTGNGSKGTGTGTGSNASWPKQWARPRGKGGPRPRPPSNPPPKAIGAAVPAEVPAPTVVAVQVPISQAMLPSASAGIMLTKMELAEMIDTLGRAESAASHAAQIAETAAKAFKNEESAIASCKMHLQRYLRH